jgi:4-hydroxymandelate oxidase
VSERRDPVDVGRIHHVDEFEAVAENVLPPATYGYVAGGAGSESTVRHNRASLERLRLVPRVLRDMTEVSTAATVLGTEISHPLIVAPSAVQRLAHPDGELATARAARDAGLLMVLSMNASTTVEEVCATGVRCWMQLYFSMDLDHMQSIVARAESAGVEALCVTVDHAGMPTRVRELHRPLEIPPEVVFVHLPEDRAKRGVNRALNWEHIDWLTSHTDLPIVLKGVLHPDDAALAVEHGVSGIIVSNHGGRQLDGVVSAYDMLPAVIDAVGDRVEVFADGGIRSGTDLLKVLALGARAGLVGRPVWWALAAAGEAGVARMLGLITEDFTAAMRLCGLADASAIGPGLLWPH